MRDATKVRLRAGPTRARGDLNIPMKETILLLVSAFPLWAPIFLFSTYSGCIFLVTALAHNRLWGIFHRQMHIPQDVFYKDWGGSGSWRSIILCTTRTLGETITWSFLLPISYFAPEQGRLARTYANCCGWDTSNPDRARCKCWSKNGEKRQRGGEHKPPESL